jgi:hypothetical protein
VAGAIALALRQLETGTHVEEISRQLEVLCGYIPSVQDWPVYREDKSSGIPDVSPFPFPEYKLRGNNRDKDFSYRLLILFPGA